MRQERGAVMGAREEQMCYVGIKPCGCCVAVCVDIPEHKKDTAKFVARCLKDGLTVERKTVEWSRKNLLMCEHGKTADLLA